MKINDGIILINDWCVRWQGDFIEPGSVQKKYLSGFVLYHPKVEDGTYLYTSLLIKKQNGCIITHGNNRYKLGIINKRYLELYGNDEEIIRKKLLDSLRGE